MKGARAREAITTETCVSASLLKTTSIDAQQARFANRGTLEEVTAPLESGGIHSTALPRVLFRSSLLSIPKPPAALSRTGPTKGRPEWVIQGEGTPQIRSPGTKRNHSFDRLRELV